MIEPGAGFVERLARNLGLTQGTQIAMEQTFAIIQ